MNLLDLMADDPAPLIDDSRPLMQAVLGDHRRTMEAEAMGLVIGARVRHVDGRTGRVFLFVPATDRVFVRFSEFERPLPVYRAELEVIGPPCAHAGGWVEGETVWPGETDHRLTKTCRECGEIRGRT